MYIIIAVLIGLIAMFTTYAVIYNMRKDRYTKYEFELIDTVIALFFGFLFGSLWPATLIGAAIAVVGWGLSFGLTNLANYIGNRIRHKRMKQKTKREAEEKARTREARNKSLKG